MRGALCTNRLAALDRMLQTIQDAAGANLGVFL